MVGNAATEANEADVQAIIKHQRRAQPPVRGTDYTGRLGVSVNLQITDQRNAAEKPEAGTVQTFPLECPGPVRGHRATTTGRRLQRDHQPERAASRAPCWRSKRTIWELGQIDGPGRRAERHRLRRLSADLR